MTINRLLIVLLISCAAASAQDDSSSAPVASSVLITSNGSHLATTNWGSCGTSACAGGAGNSTSITQAIGTGSPAQSAFVYGTNTIGTNPGLSAPSPPIVPSCGAKTSTINCMATVISNFTPTTGGTAGLGFQAPSSTPSSDPYFPQWLCGAGVPAAVMTPGCTITAPTGNTYHISPTGSDTTGDGSSTTPWASPNHSFNCGDIILASSGTYSFSNFASGKWGTVTCASGKNVAWLRCAVFDACKITTGNPNFGMYVDRSYWGIDGWEVSTVIGTSIGFSCFAAAPRTSSPSSIHHIIFANNIANGCGGGGFSSFNSNQYSVDYLVLLGNIAYNAAQSGLNCYSGISVFQPEMSDTLPGTHIFIAWNFSYGNFDPATCAGTLPTDGEGIILDTFDNKQYDPTGAHAFTQQAAVEHNILVSNGGRGLEFQQYIIGALSWPTVYGANNTIWGNSLDTHQNTSLCADMDINVGYGVTYTKNIVQTTAATACTSHNLWASWVYEGSDQDVITGNWFYAAAGVGGTVGRFGDGSMKLSYSSPASGNNVLWWQKPGNCDSCTWMKFDTWAYVPAGVANYEFDTFIEDQTDNYLLMWGKQCNTVTGKWQYANETSAWTDGPISCSLSTSTWHHLIFSDYYVKGDTSCTGGRPCLHYGSITIDGVVNSWGNTTISSDATPTGWTRTYGCQVQMDSSSSGTLIEYIDKVNCWAGK